MEEQLAALGLGVGARTVECLYEAGRPLRWSDIHRALGDRLASRGTLTKTLSRLVEADVVVNRGGVYDLPHPEATAALLEAADVLNSAVLQERLAGVEERRRNRRLARERREGTNVISMRGR
jgi:DNA-binding HxlR family transcriptional regulator